MWVAPPAEKLALVALERHEHAKAWRAVERRARDKKAAADRHWRRMLELNERVRTAAIYDRDDAIAALLIAFHEGIHDSAECYESPDLRRARDLVRKVLDWLEPQAGPPDGPPKLVG